MTLLKVYNFSITKSKGIEMVEMLDKESKRLALKIISDHKEDSNEQMSEVRKLIQWLTEKFSKEIEILKKDRTRRNENLSE
jgi:hypothetical protein